LSLADVGNSGWDPLSFCTAAGLAYYVPALARLALSTSADEPPWYAEQFVFHLGYGHLDNRLYGHCNAEQRRALADLLAYLIEIHAAHIEDIGASDAYLRCHALWSGAAGLNLD
jgi:hypothetical protein